MKPKHLEILNTVIGLLEDVNNDVARYAIFQKVREGFDEISKHLYYRIPAFQRKQWQKEKEKELKEWCNKFPCVICGKPCDNLIVCDKCQNIKTN